jgi:RNA polymerase sigma-70 factor (ECF subfamily)
MHEHASQQRVEEWARTHRNTVRAFLFDMVRRADVAEDLTQEVFCRAWEARESYQEQGKGLAYLLKIADHLVCKWGRRRKPVVNLDHEGWKCHEPATPALTPPETAATAEQVALLAQAMECLSPIQQRVLLLRYHGQLSFAEIAEITENPLSTTLSHCRRGLEALRKLLGPD